MGSGLCSGIAVASYILAARRSDADYASSAGAVPSSSSASAVVGSSNAGEPRGQRQRGIQQHARAPRAPVVRVRLGARKVVLCAVAAAAAGPVLVAADVASVVASARRVAGDGGDGTTTMTTVTTTTTTTSVRCEVAVSPCACSDLGICGWATDASGNGRCVHVPDAAPGAPVVECVFCPTQSHCPGQGCGLEQSPCACARAPQGCRWLTNLEGGICVPRGTEPPTGCNLCPSQERCAIFRPLITHFEPADRGTHEGGFAGIRVRAWFSVPVTRCRGNGNLGSGVHVWCTGHMPEIQELPAAWVTITDSVLRADVTEVLREVVLNTERECGIAIDPARICGRDTEVPFTGLLKGEYSFRLRDSIPPSLVGFQPPNGQDDVALDGTADFIFDEPVAIGKQPQAVATLSRLDVGTYSGATSTVSTEEIRLEAPHASAVGRQLTVQLSGHLQPGLLYTLSLPHGSVVDSAGNEFVGLLPRAYTLRTTEIALRSNSELSSGTGISVVAVIAIVTGAVALVGTIAVGAIRMLKGRSWAYLDEVPSVSRVILKPPRAAPSARPQPAVHSSSGPPPSSRASPSPSPSPQAASPTHASAGSDEGRGGSWAYRAPGAGANHPGPGRTPGRAGSNASRVHPDAGAAGGGAGGDGGIGGSGGKASQAGGPSGAKPAGQSTAQQGAKPQAQRSSSAPPPRASASRPPPRASASSSSASAGAGGGGASAAGNPLRAAAKEDDRCPEVKAVEKQMRDMMDQPLAARKKVLKDLMLEYHPDKNSQSHAKEVFQYVNNAKGWFLQGS